MSKLNHIQWRLNFSQWAEFHYAIIERAKAIKKARDDRAWALAETVGIPRDGCCLHNASIDIEMTGWCANTPGKRDGYDRLKIAKQVSHIVNDWSVMRLAERISNRKREQLGV